MQKEINKQIEFQEAIHKKELSTIQSDYQKKVIQGIDDLYKDQKELRAMKFEAEMADASLTNQDRQRKRREFERQELDEERKYLETKLETLTNIMSGIEVDGINFDLLPPDVRQKLEYDIEFLKNAIGALKQAKDGFKSELDLGLGGQTDILGYTPDQWETFLSNIEAGTIGIQTMSMAVGAMQNMWGEYDKMITAQENRQLQNYQRHNDGRKRMLQRQLDTGAITQEQYNKRVQQLDEETDQKKFEIELQQAKRQRAMALVNIAVNTAQAIMRIWADVPKFDFGSSSFILSALVAATGAMQAGAVMSQPLPTRGYEEGFYPVLRQQDKKPFSAQFGGNIQTGFYNKPTILVGEGAGSMPEMIIDKQAFAQISPDTKSALISELRLIKGFEKGLYNQLSQNNIAPPPGTSSQDNSNDLLLLSLMTRMVIVLEKIESDGVIGKFYDKDMESFRALEKGMKDYNELTNKAKR
jgi:tubulin-specific chaperone A